MAKRHYSSKHRADEKHEHRMHKVFGGFYEGHDPRRRQEMEDAGMISEDHKAIANLPQGVIMRPYPGREDYLPEDLDDTLRGVDEQVHMDNAKRARHFAPKKV